MNNKLVTAVLCFGSHICNQADRIRVNFRLNHTVLVPSDDVMLAGLTDKKAGAEGQYQAAVGQ